MEELKRELIKKYLKFDDFNGYFIASVKHYCETGKPSGSFFMALKELMEEYHQTQLKKLRVGDVMLRFKLRLNSETWANYKKGDEDYFYIKLLDERNGLVRFPIDKQWDIVSCEIVNEA